MNFEQAKAMQTQIENAVKVAGDALAHGTGIMRNGRRIDPAEFVRSYDDEARLADEMKGVAKRFREDARFAALIDWTVAAVCDELGPLDRDNPERSSHEMAAFAAALLLARVYTRDTELAATRAECERYRSLALNVMTMTGKETAIAHSLPNKA